MKNGDRVKFKEFDSEIEYGSEGTIVNVHESDPVKYDVDFENIGTKYKIDSFSLKKTKGVSNFNERDFIKEIYEKWVDQTCHDLDWVTHITYNDVQSKYSKIAIEYTLSVLEEILNHENTFDAIRYIKRKKVLLKTIVEKTDYKLFLDDIREPVDAFHYTRNVDHSKTDWVVVRTYEQFVNFIEDRYTESGSFPSLISFDHDLADEHYEHTSGEFPYDESIEKTGFECAKWLIDFCLDKDLQLPNFIVHSMNPVGKKNIESILNNFNKHRNV